MLGAGFLLLVYGIAVLLARALLFQAGEQRWSTTLALATALDVVGSMTLTRLTENVVHASLLFALCALLVIAWLWRIGPPFPPLARPPRPGKVAVGFALVALFLVIFAAIRGYWWDESHFHFMIANVLGRGVVPPVHPLYPIEVLKYHYACDFLAGQIRAFTGLSIVYSIDAVTIWSFILLLMSAASIGGALAGKTGAGLAMILAPLGTGLLRYFLFKDFGTMELHWQLLPSSWFDPLPPPTISNFFQHPQGLGMPLALATLSLFDGSETIMAQRRRRMAIGALLLGALSLAQAAFFLMLGLMLGAALVWRALRERGFRHLWFELSLLIAAAAIAYLLGGMFQGKQGAQMLAFGQSFFPDAIGQRILRYLVLFGVPLLALPFAFARLQRRPSMLRVALFVGAVAGYLLPNFVVYQRSWDVVKFLGIATFFANILVADLIAWTRPITIAVISILTTLTGWAFVVRMGVMDGQLGVPPMHFGRHHPIDELVADQLSPLVAPRERVLAFFPGTAQGGGFLTPGFAWHTFGQGHLLDYQALERLTRHHQRAARDLDTESLAALEVRWAVLRPEDIARLSNRGKAALADSTRFEQLFDIELAGQRRQVFRIVSPESE